ncbi:hypothetical protein [Kribbella monticola]|uniref:hypothetical protein n=1 Tax=Kribbella monticola TaxID=2185285 RepID=UPI000DD3972F|nr:hypothetical protein [Kribbella monticola]
MTTEIKDLLADAADDTAQPLEYSIDDVVRRGRRGQRLRRAGAVAAGAVTAGAFVTAVAIWTGGDVARNNGGGIQPASGPTGMVTAKQITWVAQPPAATNFTTAQIRALCNAQDSSARDGVGNKAGGGTDPVTNWSVEVSQGQAHWFRAILLSPDRLRYTFCAYNSDKGEPHDTYNREATKWFAEQPYRVTTWPNGAWGKVPAGVDKIVFELPDGTRSVATTKNGWFLWFTREHVNYLPNKPIWAIYYGADGKEIARFDSNPENPAPKPPVCTGNAHCQLDHIEPHQPVFPK